MFGRLLRLLLIAALLFVVARAVSRYLNRDEDFDDFDDVELGLEFAETPVEIDVPYETSPTVVSTAVAPAPAETETRAQEQLSQASGAASASRSETAAKEHSVIDINGIGPTYAARLKEIGIDSLDSLTNANPDEVAEKLNVIGGRNEVENWISQARDMLSTGASSGSQSGE